MSSCLFEVDWTLLNGAGETVLQLAERREKETLANAARSPDEYARTRNITEVLSAQVTVWRENARPYIHLALTDTGLIAFLAWMVVHYIDGSDSFC